MGPDLHHAPDRFLTAQRNGPAGLEPIRTEQAIDEIAARLTAIRDEHGPESIALFVGTQTYTASLTFSFAGAWLRELLAGRRWKVLVALAVLALVLLLVGRAAQHRQRVHDTRITIADVQRAIAAFRADVGRCPHTVDELLHPPRSGRRYLREVPVDGWGRAFWVRCPGRSDPGGADVVSAGPSGSFLVDDNIQ